VLGWGPFEYLVFALVAVPAIQLAVDTAMNQSADPGAPKEGFRKWRLWGYLPIICLALAGILIGANQLGLIKSPAISRENDPIAPKQNDVLIEIRPPFSIIDKNGKSLFSVPSGSEWQLSAKHH
jgi:hypothetical protein